MNGAGPNGGGLTGFAALLRTELRLFRREPFSIVFVVAFPIMMMALLAAVFGNDAAEADAVENGMLVWRGATPATYYAAASIAVVVAAFGLMTLPISLVGYRERGILRRFRASGVGAGALVGAHLMVGVATVLAGALVMGTIAAVGYDTALPDDVVGVAVALVVGTAAFGVIGLALTSLIATSRAAQGTGLIAFFSLWLISGTAPPRAVLPAGLRDLGGWLPLGRLVEAVQDPWFGFGWNWTHLGVLASVAVVVGVPALRFLRWD